MASSTISLESSKKLISCNMYTLRVPNFFTLPGYQYGGFNMNSPSFEFEDATWYFRCLEAESSDVLNSFSFEIHRLKTEFPRHNLFFKVALFKANNRKCDESECGFTRVYESYPNRKLLQLKKNCTYHDGYDPLTIVVHLFRIETLEVEAKQTSKGSLHKKTAEMKDCKISLELTNKTVFSDFFTLKFPHENQKNFSRQFKLDNATYCFNFSSNYSYSNDFTVSLEKSNYEKSLQKIFVKSILIDSNDKIISNHFQILKFSETQRSVSLGSFDYRGSPLFTLHVYLLKEEKLDVDADPATITKTVVNTTSAGCSLGSISSAVSNSTPSLFDESKNVTTSVPSSSPNESNSAISTSELCSDTSGSGLLAQDLKKIFLNGVDCDLTLRVTEKEFKVHRTILRARSQVFEAMLSHDMIEQNKGIIDIPDIDAQAMEVLLTYVYSGEVDSLSEGNVLGVYYAADKYNMAFLKNECSELIQKLLSPTIICDAIQLALNHNDKDLLECCTEYFVNYVSDILPTVKWMSFMKANPIAANELLIKATKK